MKKDKVLVLLKNGEEVEMEVDDFLGKKISKVQRELGSSILDVKFL